jgi:hypothetical protein
MGEPDAAIVAFDAPSMNIYQVDLVVAAQQRSFVFHTFSVQPLFLNFHMLLLLLSVILILSLIIWFSLCALLFFATVTR